jgi:hypothetical protein
MGLTWWQVLVINMTWPVIALAVLAIVLAICELMKLR